jgi:hypothetical protein
VFGEPYTIKHYCEHASLSHCVHRIRTQVHGDPVELGRITHDRRISRLEVPLQAHVSGKRRCEQLERLLDNGLHAHGPALVHPTAAESEDAVNERSGGFAWSNSKIRKLSADQ